MIYTLLYLHSKSMQTSLRLQLVIFCLANT
jgi:hypothetical protein